MVVETFLALPPSFLPLCGVGSDVGSNIVVVRFDSGGGGSSSGPVIGIVVVG